MKKLVLLISCVIGATAWAGDDPTHPDQQPRADEPHPFTRTGRPREDQWKKKRVPHDGPGSPKNHKPAPQRQSRGAQPKSWKSNSSPQGR